MKKFKGEILVIGTAIISGFSIFINQFGVKISNSDIYTFSKNLIAGLLIAAVVLLAGEYKKIKNLTAGNWRLLVVIGLIGGCIPFFLFYKGLAISAASSASMIHKSMFLPVALLALVFLKEKINKNLLIGILLLAIGNVLLLKFDFHNSWQTGEWLVLLAVAFWSVENILSKKAVAGIPPKIVAASRMIFGCGFMAIYLLMTGRLASVGQLNVQQLWWILLTAGILVAYQLTWYSGIKHIGISTAACLLALGAPITTALTLFNGKHLAASDYLAFSFFIVALAVILVPGKMKKLAYEIR